MQCKNYPLSGLEVVKYKPPTMARQRRQLDAALSRMLRDKCITRTTKRNVLAVFDRRGSVTHEMDEHGREVLTTQETRQYLVRRAKGD